MSKVVIVTAFAPSLVNFRGDLIREMCAAGHEVVAVAPEADARACVVSLGAGYRSFGLDRAGGNPLSDALAVRELAQVFTQEQPDLVFAYGVKPVLYSAIAHAAARGGGRLAALINGLGYVFDDLETRPLRRAALVGLRSIYGRALRRYDTVIFQNPDDAEEFRSRGYLAPSTAVTVVAGSGVNTERFACSPLRADGEVVFLFIGRLLSAKGIRELAAACTMLRPEFRFRCQVLGPFDTTPHAIDKDEMRSWQDDGVVEYLGVTEDVRPFIEEASCLVLPSYYREGVPRSVLEAMSMGRPIITTDAPGCRETVIEGKTGYLVAPRSATSLRDAMRRVLERPPSLGAMGRAARELAEEKFDVRVVNAAMMAALKL